MDDINRRLQLRYVADLKKPDIAHGIEHTRVYIKIDKDTETKS